MKGLFTPDSIMYKREIGAGTTNFFISKQERLCSYCRMYVLWTYSVCRNCDVTLTFHQYSNSLKCHYCGFSEKNQEKCLECNSVNIDKKGYGTQQIEEQIKSLFTNATVDRMDWDTTRGKFSVDKIFEKFENHKIDILIGTQMITKGLDFKNIGLVGVINADSILFFPNFRSNEKLFRL